MTNDYERVEYRGHIIRIVHDYNVDSPREWDNLGEILYTSAKYALGDRRVSLEDIKEVVDRDDVVWLPIYAYIHGNIALSTSSFSDMWDSGQSGIIWAERSKFGKCDDDIIRATFVDEIKTFNQYLSGETFAYIVESSNGIQICSCWGFFGTECIDDMIRDAKENIDCEIEESENISCLNG